MNPSMVAEQTNSDAEGLFTAFRKEERINYRRWVYIAMVPLIPLIAVVAAWVSMLGQEDAMRIITAHGIKVVNPGMAQQDVIGLIGRPIGKEMRAADGAECFLHGMFSMTEPQTTVYLLCYTNGVLHDMSTRRYSLWAADPNGEFTPAGVNPGGGGAKSPPAAKP
ncbi:hypothetical protein [Hyalangium versicolor]|uniref:hypothetical protein n=1 Tax=Hyalangium versicolor TaxID=2861190 RepID=UPI001CCDD2CA|nr:hypothetical protein [Hyalangium versicolor]